MGLLPVQASVIDAVLKLCLLPSIVRDNCKQVSTHDIANGFPFKISFLIDIGNIVGRLVFLQRLIPKGLGRD